MIRGGDFYAVWDERKGVWSTDQDDVTDMIDEALDRYKMENKEKNPALENARVAYMWNGDTGTVDKWKHYVKKQLPENNYHPLNGKLVFANSEVRREDYSSIRLPYALEEGDCPAWDEMVGTLYSPEERHKIEWAIGAVVSGESKNLQKFIVFYGDSGTGKSTIMNVIEKLFDGYGTSFNAKALGSSTSDFALEPFKNNPLVAIQQDGDLSRIEDNARLNSLVSHEELVVNEKFKGQYPMRFQTMLFMGTNRPVKITDSKSGIIRRLIDISPTGNLIPRKRYDKLVKNVNFELGAIAWKCLQVFEEDPHYYDNYIPKVMIGATNDFYNFMEEYFDEFRSKNSTTLKEAYAKYKMYCDEAKVPYPYPMRVFKEELKNYFKVYKERFHPAGREWIRNWYEGFKIEKFGIVEESDISGSGQDGEEVSWLSFTTTESEFDKIAAGWPAQYAAESGKPSDIWDRVETVLADLNTGELHYVLPPDNYITIDFDLKDENGEKSLSKNIEAASKWPPTYAELSKSGSGIHLEYYYAGDPSKLSAVYAPNVEIKVFTGKASLRRKLTRCNELPIATISSGLPLKEEKKVISEKTIKDEKHLRSLVSKALRREIEPYATKTSIDFIDHILTQAKESGMHYDLSDMKADILAFAGESHNHSLYCIDKAMAMEYRSDEPSTPIEAELEDYVFFDVEVFPNLFIVCLKPMSKDAVSLINPSPDQIMDICKFRLIGFNNRKYDNHILYARIQGKNEFELFTISQNIINGGKENSVRNEYMYREAYNLSYTDVYDFCAKKQSLKKWEIQLGIHHMELGLPWDEPVPEDKWELVAEYCKNDVIATEAVFEANKADFLGREILCDLANILVGPGSTVNDTTNTLTTKLIVGNERNPQSQFVKPDLSLEFPGYEYNPFGIDKSRYISEDVIITGKSIYKGYDPGEGGFVYARHGMYDRADCYDSASHHPSSLIAENGFGPFTENFKRLLDLRLMIKHKEYDKAKSMYGGALAKYLETKEDAKALSYALKIAINSVYGLTAAKFDTKLHDPRNIDNWVAKRGALFMIDLMLEVEKRGYTVIHIKTDSIKIENPDNDIFQFVYDFGKKYGYTFEIEHKFEKLCLVNDAVYICKYTNDPENEDMAGCWEATGAQFQQPFVFKTLFSHEPIEFKDLCVTQTVQVGMGLYLDMNEDLPDVSVYEKEVQKLQSKWRKNGFELNDANDILLLQGSGPWDGVLSAEEFRNSYHQDYVRMCELNDIIKPGHAYKFVGKAGQFCPMVSGCGAGLLVRENRGKMSFATGSSGYRWMESEMVKKLHMEDQIDYGYFRKLVDEAKAAISNYGDFESFAGD